MKRVDKKKEDRFATIRIRRKTYNKLSVIKEKKGIPISTLVDEAVNLKYR